MISRTQERPLTARPSLSDLLSRLADRRDYVVLGDFSPASTARYHYLGLVNTALTVTLTSDQKNPLRRLQTLFIDQPVSESIPAWPFYGGWVGFLSYDLARVIEVLPDDVEHDLVIPLGRFFFCDAIIAWDNEKDRGALLALEHDRQQRSADDRLQELQELCRARPVFHEDATGVDLGDDRWQAHFSANFTMDEYLAAIERARHYIRIGDIYEVNLSRRLSCVYEESPAKLYRELTHQHPADYSALLRSEAFSLVSASPELFLLKRGRHILTRPIKGTIARGLNAAEDQANYRALLDSQKDRAELNMIIDLERNDLGRVCEWGSVRVDRQRIIEKHPTLYHAVAAISGTLHEDVELEQVIRATFPGGSVIGAPKIRAMEIIDELEPTARSAYCGSIGWIGLQGDFDFNIAIRTIILQNGRAYLQTGGAIVDDSDPQREYEETLVKAAGCARAILSCGGASNKVD